MSDSLRGAFARTPLTAYLGVIAVITAGLSAYLASIALGDNLSGWRLWLLCVLAVIATSQLAVTLVNWVATMVVTPRALPRMDFSKEDAADDLALNEVVWRSVRGANSPMPAPRRAGFVFNRMEDDD